MSQGLPATVGAVLRRLATRPLTGAVAGLLLLGYGGGSAIVGNQLAQTVDARSPTPGAGRFDQAVYFKTSDDVHLWGWLFPSKRNHGVVNHTTRSVILVHGLFANRMSQPNVDLANHFLQRGFDVFMFDLRGQGESGSAQVTLGNKERLDVLAAYGLMKGRGYSPSNMLIVGVSMGGVATIEAEPQMRDVGAIEIIDAPAELEPLVRRALAQRNPVLPLLEPGIRLYALAVLGIDVNLRPVDVVAAESDRAFLFIQGGSDDFVTPNNADELYRASKNPNTREIVIPGVGHDYSSLTPEQMTVVGRAIDGFADQQLGGHIG